MRMYWAQRQEQLWQALEKDEAALTKRMEAIYAREAAGLEKEIAAYYAKYGEDGVIRYRSLLQSLGDDDKALLLERMDAFAQKYPQNADLLPVRESIYKLDRLEGLQQSIYLQQLELAAWDDAQLTQHLAKNAMRGYAGAAKFTGGGTFTVREDIVRKFVGTPWADGKNFSQRIWGNRTKLAGYLNQDFAMAMARGDNYAKCVKALRGRFDVGASSAKALAYTEGSYIMNESSIGAFADWYEEYAVSCAGDGKVCDKCAPLDGKRFRIKERVTGVNFPPFHTRCRCSYTVVAESVKAGAYKYGDRKHIPVTEQSINNVKKVQTRFMTQDQAGHLRDTHRQILHAVQNAPEETEAITYLDSNLKAIKIVVGEKKGVVNIGEPPVGAVGIAHNHPSGRVFSFDDISNFSVRENLNVMTVVGNNGSVYVLEKTDEYDFASLYHLLQRTIDSTDIGTLITEQQKVEFVEGFLYEAAKSGIVYTKG